MNYAEIRSKCKPDNIFDTVTIKITITPFKMEGSPELEYSIEDIGIDNEKCSDIGADLYKELDSYCQQLKERIDKNLPMRWKVFYLYKELFQMIVSKEKFGKFNYFRGQAQNWDTIPGIFRANTANDFISSFESIYKRVGIEFPNEVEYIKYQDDTDILKKRARELALLQHYGMRTSLLDLTRNPYIALQFMVSDASKQDFSSGIVEAYAIDEIEHEQNNIFMSIEKEENNRRLKAQDGAFLYYDRLSSLEIEKISRIPRIVIELCYDTNRLENLKEKEIKETTQALESLRKSDNVSPGMISMLERELESLKKDISNIHEEVDKTEIFEMIHNEVKSKLNEYFYFEEDLFPDLYKYIEYMQPKYIAASNVQLELGI